MYDRSGFGFVGVWIAILDGVSLAAIGIVAYRRSRSVLAAALPMIGLSWMGAVYFAPRPVIVSLAALSLLVLVCEADRLHWAVPLVIWLWSASHGSFIIGIGYLVLQAFRSRRRRFVALAFTGVVVASLTAHGFHAWSVLWQFFSNRDALEVIQEWGTPEILTPLLWPYTAGMAIILYRLASGAIRKDDLWILVPFFIFGMTSKRAVFVSAIVLAAWVAKPDSKGQPSAVPGFPTVVLGVVGASIVAFPLFSQSITGQLSDSMFPVAAADHLMPGPLFHDAVVGGYLIFAGDGRRVLVDDRAELYGREFFDRVIAAEVGRPAWRSLFEDEGIEQTLLRNDDGLSEVLREEGWLVRYSDEVFTVLSQP